MLAGVNRFRFRRIVVPGDVIRLEATCTQRVRTVTEFRTAARVGGEIAADGSLQLAFRG